MTAGFVLILLERFARGEIGLVGVQESLAQALRAGQVSDQELAGNLKDALDRGMISAEAFRLLAQQVAEGPRSIPRATPAESGGTMLRSEGARGGPRAREGTMLRQPSGSAIQSPASHPRRGTSPGTGPATDALLGDPQNWTGVWGQGVVIGDVLNERYRLERMIGHGGMGDVYLAYDQVEDGYFAVKVLTQDFRDHPDAWRALKEEVRKSRDLAHPNIVGVYSLQRDHTNAYMVMEYLEGKPLDRLLAEDYARGMPFQQALPIVRAAAEALAYAHDRGVIHSDLKPSNLFVLAGGRAKVLDFGIARAVRGPRDGRFDARELGALTPEYASPEMIAGDQAPDVRDDVYGFACLVYELVTGRHPFGSDDAAKARTRRGARGKPDPAPGLTRRQSQALARGLAFERSDRTASIEFLLAELQGQAGAGGYKARQIVVLAAAGVVLLAVAVWAGNRVLAPSESDIFRAALVQSLPPATEYADPNEIATLIELGNYYLQSSREAFDPGALSRGVSSASGAFSKALKLDPSNPEALGGVVRVFETYLERAEGMAKAGQWPAAREAAVYGLDINPDSQRLRKVLGTSESRVGSGQ